MNIMPTKRSLKILAVVAAGISTLIYAVAVFIPSTQPTVLLGQYALQERDLYNSTGTIAYRPWFENGAWQGDVIEYFITSSGVRQTDVPVGANPATSGTAGGCGRTAPSGCWSARATFIAKGADSPTGSYWTTRNIFTHNGGQVNFGWDQLSPLQRSGLDPDTVAAALTTPSLNSDPNASPILNYIRGQRLNERANNAETNSTGDLRTRYSVLGDITGTPVYIGPPKELLGRVTGYNTFASNNASRAGRVAVGANDGMLHVFDEADGSEVFGYVPSMVIDKLKLLASRDAAYTHTYYVDGELTTGSAQIQTAWKTILTGGGGAGFAGLYALDMTDPAYTNSKLLFEKSGGNWGHVYGRPRIAPVGGTNAVPNWYIFAGNGYSTNASHPTSLMMIDLNDFGVDSQDFSVTEIAISDKFGPVTGGLSAPVLVSTDSDDMVELAFAGDINGDLYMFVIDQSTPSNTQAILVYDGSPDQPITNAPAISEHPTEPGYMVYFGTGSILSLTDALNDGESTPGNYSKTQAIHGIWVDTSDIAALKLSLPYDSSDLRSQTMSEIQNYTFGSTVETVRIVPSENAVPYGCPLSSPSCTTYKGWKVTLPNCGERLVGAPFIRAGRVQFVTHNPTGLNCGTTQTRGDSWVMSLDFLTGGDGNDIVYNLNGDSTLDNNDSVLLSGVYKAPIGLHLGPGNISQPAFARLKLGTDKMFINGVLLPLPNIPPPGPLFGGHIDVTVDSPFGGEISPNNLSKHSEGYNIQTHDGLGRAVDGHVHDYDTMHDVQYVDLFELEPRRGKANLATALNAATDLSKAAACSSSPNSKEKTVLDSSGNSIGCIEAIEGELNRAYDTLHTNADGVIEAIKGVDASGAPAPVYQSEVNPTKNGAVYSGYVDGFNATTPADFTTPETGKPFIVTLANADLSPGGMLQIGCRVWPVIDYQDMVTAQLQDGRTSTAGLVDQNGISLVLTLNGPTGILSENPDNCPGGLNSSMSDLDASVMGLAPYPTIRVGFRRTDIIGYNIHATRSQCVLGLHDYKDAVCYTDQQVLSAAESQFSTVGYNPTWMQPSSCGGLGSSPPLGYVRLPSLQKHITKADSSEYSGLNDLYRWRNGALTVQFMDAAIDPSVYLQDPATMVPGAGTIAKAFTLSGSGSGSTVTATPAEEIQSPLDESGLMYEATMFWHYSALVDEYRNADPASNQTPKDAGCYGGSAYNGKTVIDVGGLTSAEYMKLTKPLLDDCALVAANNLKNNTNIVCDLDEFANILARIDSAQTDADLNQALFDLNALLASNPDLAEYAAMRDYVGSKVRESDRVNVDKIDSSGSGSGNESSLDGTPNQTTQIETIDLEARGPNYIFGRRNWVDIRQ